MPRPTTLALVIATMDLWAPRVQVPLVWWGSPDVDAPSILVLVAAAIVSLVSLKLYSGMDVVVQLGTVGLARRRSPVAQLFAVRPGWSDGDGIWRGRWAARPHARVSEVPETKAKPIVDFRRLEVHARQGRAGQCGHQGNRCQGRVCL